MSNRPAAFLIRIAVLALAAFALQRFVLLPWHANHELDAVERNTEVAAAKRGAEREIMARDNIERLDRVAAGARSNVDYYILAAENARIAGDAQLSVDRYTAALTVDQRPEIYFGRGMMRFEGLNDLDGAIADLTKAVEFAPSYRRRIYDPVLRDRVQAPQR
jgi:tetratricopeptide (TPR) repeat protein